MWSWSGMVRPESLLEDLTPFMDHSPSHHHIGTFRSHPRESFKISISRVRHNPDESKIKNCCAFAASMENNEIDEGATKKADDTSAEAKVKKPAYVPLPKKPKGDKHLIWWVGIHLPDWRRVQQNFLQTDSIQWLWSFCHSELEKEGTRAFRLTQAIQGGASKTLDPSSNSIFEDMISTRCPWNFGVNCSIRMFITQLLALSIYHIWYR